MTKNSANIREVYTLIEQLRKELNARIDNLENNHLQELHKRINNLERRMYYYVGIGVGAGLVLQGVLKFL